MPGTSWTTTAAPDVVPGITGVNHYRVNSRGIRGRPFGADSAEYRVLAVGGSTTECANLDDSEAWSGLLETSLSRTADGRAVWAGNIGRSGLTTRDNALHLKFLLRQYPRMDAVVALVGANDLQAALQEEHYRQPGPITDPVEQQARLLRSFSYVAGRTEQRAAAAPRSVPWYKVTELWQLGRRVRQGSNAVRHYDLSVLGPRGLFGWRALRQGARRRIDTLPPLEAPLAEFRNNLNAMVDKAAASHTRLVFVTQPTMWGDHLPDSVSRTLWFGWVGPDRLGPKAYYTAAALARGMEAFNAELLTVCRDRGVECVDAAGTLSHDATAFYDDMHFTERGSALLAEQLAGHFRREPPFGPAGGQLQPRPEFPTMKRSRPRPSP